MTPVSIVRCKSYDPDAVDEAVRRATELLGGISRYVKKGDRVLLKPNLLSARKPEKRVTTDPEVVRAVAMMVIEAGGKPFIGDSPGIDSFKRVAVKSGMAGVAERLSIECVELRDPRPVGAIEGAEFKNLEIASQALEADVVINLPKLKAHCQMGLTLGVKNLFGTIVAQRKAEWHHMAGVDRDIFASLLLDIYRGVGPSLTIVDGVWGMEGNGPSNGIPRKLDMIAASEDCVALDMAVCSILRVPLSSFPLYRAARKRGIGETNLQGIEFRGDSPDSLSVKDFIVPELDSLNLLPGGFDWFTKRFLVSKPVQDDGRCVRCGQCAEICPVDAIEVGEKHFHMDYDRCIRCYCCQEICPQDAIRFRKGLLVRFLNRISR